MASHITPRATVPQPIAPPNPAAEQNPVSAFIGQVGQIFHGTVVEPLAQAVDAGKQRIVRAVADEIMETGKSFLCKLMGKASLDKELAPLIAMIQDALPVLPIPPETLVICVLHNLARKTFLVQAQKIENNQLLQRDEIIPFDLFINNSMNYVYNILREGILQLDGVERIVKESFEPLADKILTACIPEGFVGGVARGRVKNILVDSLYEAYQKYLTPPAKDAAKEQHGLWNIPEALFQFFGFAFFLPTLKTEKEYFHQLDPSDQLFDTLSHTVETLVADSEESLRKKLLMLQGLPLTDIQLVVKAALFKILGNVMRVKQIAPAAPEIIKQQVFAYLRDMGDQMFIGANLYQAEGISQVAHYVPGVCALAHAFFSHDVPLVEFLIKKRPDLFEKASEIVQECHLAFKRDDRPDYEQRLRVILWDPEALQRLHPTIERIPKVPDVHSSELLGTEKFVVQMRNGFNHVGKMALEMVLEMMPLLKQEQNKHIRQFIQKNISSFLLKVFVTILEKGKKVRGATKENALFYAVKLFLKQFVKNPPKEGKADYQAYQPLAKALIKFACQSNRVFINLPLPKWASDLFFEALETKHFPQLLHNMHTQSYAWIDKREQNRKTLQGLYHNQRMAETATVLAHYAEQYVPFFLRLNPKWTADFIAAELQDWMLVDPEQPAALPLEAEALTQFKSMLSASIQMLGRSRSKEIAVAFEFIRNYSEGFLLEGFATLAHSIDEIERAHRADAAGQHEGAPHIKVATLLFNQARKHYALVNQIKKGHGKTHASKVPDKVMRQEFGRKLHPLLKTDEQQAHTDYFKKVGKKVLPLLLREERLPAPDFMESAAWKIFQDGVLPLLMTTLIDETRAPHAIQLYLNTLLKKIKDNLATMEAKDFQELENVPNDPLQREIEALLAELLQELIGLQPSLAQPFAHFRSLWTQAGHEMGKGVRASLERTRLIELLEQAICSGVPLLHGGGWITAGQMREWLEPNPPGQIKRLPNIVSASIGDHFFPLRKNARGEVEHGWNFQLPQDEAEMEAQTAKLEQSRQNERKQLDERLAEMIEYQGYKSIDATLSMLWKNLQTKLDKAIEAAFGKAGTRLKELLDKFFNFIWEHGLKFILNTIFYPFKQIIEAILHRYFMHQARMRVGDVASPIHQNLFLRTFDQSATFLLRKRQMA